MGVRFYRSAAICSMHAGLKTRNRETRPSTGLTNIPSDIRLLSFDKTAVSRLPTKGAINIAVVVSSLPFFTVKCVSLAENPKVDVDVVSYV